MKEDFEQEKNFFFPLFIHYYYILTACMLHRCQKTLHKCIDELKTVYDTPPFNKVSAIKHSYSYETQEPIF